MKMIDATLYGLILLIAFFIYKKNSNDLEHKKNQSLIQNKNKSKKHKSTFKKKIKQNSKAEFELKEKINNEPQSLPENSMQNNLAQYTTTEPAKENKSNHEKYNFNTIYEFSRYDFDFMNHFESLGVRDYQKKLNSIQSAIESGVIDQKIIYRMIYAELTQISRLPADSPKDPDIAQFMNELVIIWRAQDPTYINQDLVRSLVDTVKSENEYLTEMKDLIQ